MTKPGREADDLGHMIAKMMAAQAGGPAAAGAAAGAGAGAGAGQGAPKTVGDEEKDTPEVLEEEYSGRRRPTDEEAALPGHAPLRRQTTNATVSSQEELDEASWAPVAPVLKSDDGHS